jgi:hypothetical protein
MCPPATEFPYFLDRPIKRHKKHQVKTNHDAAAGRAVDLLELPLPLGGEYLGTLVAFCT